MSAAPPPATPTDARVTMELVAAIYASAFTGPWDHVWHKGLTLSLPYLGTDNLRGGPTFVRDEGYRWLENNGAMRHRGDAAIGIGDAEATIRHTLAMGKTAG